MVACRATCPFASPRCVGLSLTPSSPNAVAPGVTACCSAPSCRGVSKGAGSEGSSAARRRSTRIPTAPPLLTYVATSAGLQSPQRFHMKWDGVSIRLTDCEVLSFADELRQAQSDARRQLGADGRPKKAAISAFVAEVFEADMGAHGAGYDAARTAFGGRRWHYRCPGCSRRVQRLHRPLGWEGWACRSCAGVKRIRRDRGVQWAGPFWPLVWELEAYAGRPGRRPRRFHRGVRHASAMVTAAQIVFA